MLQEWTRFHFLLHATERDDPDVQVSVIGDLGIVGDELAVGGPVCWEFRTLRIEHTLGRSAAERLTEKTHAAVIAPAKQNFVAVRRPNGVEFGLANVRFCDSEDRVVA